MREWDQAANAAAVVATFGRSSRRAILPGMRPHHLRLWILPLTIYWVGCLHNPSAQRGYALYQVAGARPSPTQVATLTEEKLIPGNKCSVCMRPLIKSIDGREVSDLGGYFELLPGCHRVQTEDGSAFFPLNMRPGFRYSIVRAFTAPMGGGRARVSVYGVERDSTGAQTQTIEASSSVGNETFCQS